MASETPRRWDIEQADLGHPKITNGFHFDKSPLFFSEIRFERLDSKGEPFTLRLDIKTIKEMASGSCAVPSNQEKDDIVVVCKENNMVKIFKMIEEKK